MEFGFRLFLYLKHKCSQDYRQQANSSNIVKTMHVLCLCRSYCTYFFGEVKRELYFLLLHIFDLSNPLIVHKLQLSRLLSLKSDVNDYDIDIL